MVDSPPKPPPRPARGAIPRATILRATLRRMVGDQVGLVAAGCAFYATLALFPAITMLIFIYGLAFDPTTVEPQLRVMEELLPPDAYSLIAGRVHVLVTQPRGTLGLGSGSAFPSPSGRLRPAPAPCWRR